MQKQLRKSDIKDLNLELSKYDVELGKKDKVIVMDELLMINNKSEFFYYENKPVPLLKSNKTSYLKKITVDMGAIKFVTSGADIMRPGITEIDTTIELGEVIGVVDENNKAVIAIGQAKLSGKDMTEATSGKVVKNVHHVGDEIWDKS